jgi:hypothetical protein
MGDIHTDTDCSKGFMKYAVEIGSGVMIYTLRFIKIDSGIQKLMGGIPRHRQHGDLLNLLIFVFKIRKEGYNYR